MAGTREAWRLNVSLRQMHAHQLVADLILQLLDQTPTLGEGVPELVQKQVVLVLPLALCGAQGVGHLIPQEERSPEEVATCKHKMASSTMSFYLDRC